MSAIATRDKDATVHTSPICLTVVFTDREYIRYSDYRKNTYNGKYNYPVNYYIIGAKCCHLP
ncbi:hypothetical protein [Odoribacter lunatus]|uniref:hypothetical protein n=1 Tax=Odoribacter lunatus TaxID=2941335 RepID=UPI00203B4884|nr:hypothetical protein [Odoribacter lunatus]